MIRNVLPPFLWFTAENLVETNSFISRIRVGVLFWWVRRVLKGS